MVLDQEMSVAESKVSGIVKALSSLEDDIDSLNSRVSEVQKNISAKTQSELVVLADKVKEMATLEAESIINAAKSKAETEAARIAQEGEATLTETQSKIDASFDEAIDIVVSTVLKA